MACHYPDPNATEVLRRALVAMDFEDHSGADAAVSEYGIPYKRITAFDDSPEALADMACAHLTRELANGGAIIWRKLPLINGFEEGRKHKFVLVLEYHVRDDVNDEAAIGDQHAEASPTP